MKKGLPLKPAYKLRLKSLKENSKSTYGLERAKAMLSNEASKSAIKLASSIASETQPKGLEAAARIIQEADNSLLLTKLVQPVTIIYGGKDPVVSWEKTSELNLLIPQSKLISIPNSGHAPYIEFPKLFNKILQNALIEN